MPKLTIGEFLAIQRKAKGMTQQEVADLLGISNKTLSSWESGRSYPDILTLPALAELYGVTVDEILSGERATHVRETEGISERSQKKLLKKAGNKYSVKCTVLTFVGVGGIVLFALAAILGLCTEPWVFLLLALLGLAAEFTAVLLFSVFEKSALAAEEEPSRYSLLIKRTTFRAALAIGCALCAFLIVSALIAWVAVGNGMTAGLMIFVLTLLVGGAVALFLGWLSGRGKAFYTADEAAARLRNRKLLLKILPIGAAAALILFVLCTVLSLTDFTRIEKLHTSPKEEFLRGIQTIGLDGWDAETFGVSIPEGGDYFVDVKAALSAPPVRHAAEEKLGLLYPVEGNLYFAYSIGSALSDFPIDGPARSGTCEVVYVPDLSEQVWEPVAYGTVLFRDRAQFDEAHPDPTAEDLRAGMEAEEVFFAFGSRDREEFVVYGFRVRLTSRSAPYVIVTADDYTLAVRVTETYPIVRLAGLCAILLGAAAYIWIYCKKRAPIDLRGAL